MFTVGQYEIDETKIAPAVVTRLLQRATAHILNNECSANVLGKTKRAIVGKDGKPDTVTDAMLETWRASEANKAQIVAWEDVYCAEKIAAMYDGTLSVRVARGPSRDPEEAAARAIAKREVEGIFKTKTRDEWCQVMEGSDVCFAPVLTMKEASQHPHAKARNAYVDVQGFPQPAAAPRFSRTKESVKGPAAKRGQHTDEVLLESGFSSKEVGELRDAGIIGAQ